MPKLGCPCGFVHNLSPIPDDGWTTVRDRDYEDLIDTEIAARDDQDAEGRVTRYHGLLYECPECGRIMWEKPGEDRFKVFVPEDT